MVSKNSLVEENPLLRLELSIHKLYLSNTFHSYIFKINIMSNSLFDNGFVIFSKVKRER